LVRIQLADGRSFTGHRSNQKEYLLQQILSHHLPESVDGDAYKLALDIERRYYGTVLQWFFPDRGIYVEGGCFTGMRAIRWHDLAIEPVKILAVEIGKSNCEILRTNIAQNGLSASIVPVHAGLWSESGEGVQKHSFSTRRFLETTDNWREHMRHEERVRLLTVGDLLDECEVEVADFLNLQVNGAEVKVIEGMRRNLDRVKVISVASYYSRDGVKNSEVIEDMLTSAGCTVIHRTEQGRLAVATPKFRDEILALPRRAIRRKIPKESLQAR
jgi:FkbM family methyltransferase